MLFHLGTSVQNTNKTHWRGEKGKSLQDPPHTLGEISWRPSWHHHQEGGELGYAHYPFQSCDPCGFENIIGEQQKTTGIFVRNQPLLQTQGLLTFLQSTFPSSTACSSMALACLCYQGTLPPSKVPLSLAISVNPVCLQSSVTLIFQLLQHFQPSNKATKCLLCLYSETRTNSWSSALIYKRYLHAHLLFLFQLFTYN